MSDLKITTGGAWTRIDYDGQTFVPFAECDRRVSEAVALARADERERIAQAIETAELPRGRGTLFERIAMPSIRVVLGYAAEIARTSHPHPEEGTEHPCAAEPDAQPADSGPGKAAANTSTKP